MSHEDELTLLSPQMDKFVKKFTSGRVHYIVHDWTALSYKDTLK